MLEKRSIRCSIVILLLILLAAQLGRLTWLYSATWDEAHHLYDGYTIWTKYDYRLNAEVPPLVKLIAAIPLLAFHLDAPPNLGRSEPKEEFVDGRLFVVGNGPDRTLLPGRIACMLFPLLLAWLMYVCARNMFGTVAAVATLLLFIFDPNVLANGIIVSTDVGSACCFFGAVYAFYRYVQQPSHSRLALAAIATGLVTVSKFTGLLIIPMLMLLSVAEAISFRSFHILGKRLGSSAVMCLSAWAIIWAFYGFRFAPGPNGAEFSPTLLPYIESMPNKADVSKLLLLAKYHVLPQAYIWGLANTKKTEWYFTSYFFGRIYRHGPWQYFPAAFLIKTTLPLLILLVSFPFLWSLQQSNRKREIYFLLIPVLVYFLVVTLSHFDIGVRHLMPIYPFLYILAGATIAVAFSRNIVWKGIAVLLLFWQVGTSLRAASEYTAYGNEAWGGPPQVHRYLSDSNVDWGQELNSVRMYINEHHISNCWFAYFADGAIQPEDYGVHCHRLPTPSSLWWLELPMDVPPAIEGTVFISDGELEGVESGDGELNPYKAFRQLTPVVAIQQGVYVYQGSFSVPLASALVKAHESRIIGNRGELEDALGLALQAAELAPSSAIVQQNLGDRMAALQDWEGALDHYHLAKEAALHQRPDLQESLLKQLEAEFVVAEKHVRALPGK